MKTAVKNCAAVLFLLLIDFVVIGYSLDFVRLYPLDRMLAGDTLVYRTHFTGESPRFRHKIIAIEDEAVGNHSVINILKKHHSASHIRFTFQSPLGVYDSSIERNEVNQHVLAFLLFLVLFANIHYLWGIIIANMYPNRFYGRVYLRFSLALSFFFFACTDVLSFYRFPMLFSVAVIFLAEELLHIGWVISHSRKKTIIRIMAVAAVVVFLYSLTYSNKIFDIKIYVLFSAYILAAVLYLIVQCVRRFIASRDIVVVRMAVYVPLMMIAGVLLPFFVFFISPIYDAAMPLTFAGAMTLLFPLSLGEKIVSENLVITYLFLSHNILLFFADVLFAFLLGYIIYATVDFPVSLMGELFSIFIIFFAFTFLFYVRYFIRTRVRGIQMRGRNFFYSSLRTVAEMVSSPENAADRIKSIIAEASKQTGVKNLAVLFFTDMSTDRQEYDGFVSYMPLNSPLSLLCRRNATIVMRHSLFPYVENDMTIKQFLDAHRYDMLIPKVEGGIITAFFCVGEKTGCSSFSAEERHYMVSLSSLVFSAY